MWVNNLLPNRIVARRGNQTRVPELEFQVRWSLSHWAVVAVHAVCRWCVYWTGLRSSWLFSSPWACLSTTCWDGSSNVGSGSRCTPVVSCSSSLTRTTSACFLHRRFLRWHDPASTMSSCSVCHQVWRALHCCCPKEKCFFSEPKS